jgi:hypothetical protein
LVGLLIILTLLLKLSWGLLDRRQTIETYITMKKAVIVQVWPSDPANFIIHVQPVQLLLFLRNAAVGEVWKFSNLYKW